LQRIKSSVTMKRSADATAEVIGEGAPGNMQATKRRKVDQEEALPERPKGERKRSKKDKSKKSEREEDFKKPKELSEHATVAGTSAEFVTSEKSSEQKEEAAKPSKATAKDGTAGEKRDKKKRKRTAKEEGQIARGADSTNANSINADKPPKQRRQHGKNEEEASENTVDRGQANEPLAEVADTGRKDRFIVFIGKWSDASIRSAISLTGCTIGNLPYTATKEVIFKHFQALQPTDVRLLHQRDDHTKSRGIAFLEFARFDHMKTCLKKFHHTEFNDGISPVRRINVELTVGGGGSKANRKEKIRQKNSKLREERVRRIQEEQKVRREKQDGTLAVGSQTAQEEGTSSMHPSRRGRVPRHKR
jgi:nucleolar protein 6